MSLWPTSTLKLVILITPILFEYKTYLSYYSGTFYLYPWSYYMAGSILWILGPLPFDPLIYSTSFITWGFFLIFKGNIAFFSFVAPMKLIASFTRIAKTSIVVISFVL